MTLPFMRTLLPSFMYGEIQQEVITFIFKFKKSQMILQMLQSFKFQ